MNESMTEREILEWYVTAGVDCICGDEPWMKFEKSSLVASSREDKKAVQSRENQSTVIPLSQTIVSACQNARQICMKVDNLEDLRTLVETFDGCSLRMTANKTVFGYGSPTADLLLIGEAPGAEEDRR